MVYTRSDKSMARVPNMVRGIHCCPNSFYFFCLTTHVFDCVQFAFKLPLLPNNAGARGSAVGWGTALQARRSRARFPMVSLKFFVYIILPAALWPWGWFSLLQPLLPRNISWGVKATGAQGWKPYHLHVPIVLKSGNLNLLEPSGTAQACNGIALPFYQLTL